MNQLENQIPNSNKIEIPTSPKERQTWFMMEYWDIVNAHVINLRTYFWHFPSDKKSITFNDITEEGDAHIVYGDIHIYFPINKIKNSNEWKRAFDVFIDGKLIPLESKIEAAQSSMRESIVPKLNWIQKLTPPIVRAKPVTSQKIVIKRKIEIKQKI